MVLPFSGNETCHAHINLCLCDKCYIFWLYMICLLSFSALWPFSTLGWPDESAEDFKRFYPTTMLETGYEPLCLTPIA